MEGIECPVKITDIDRFEAQNPTITIVVLGYDNETGVYPIRNQRTFKREHLVVLLLITNNLGNSHYVLVKNPSALLSSKLSKNSYKLFCCWNCSGHCTSEKILERHQDYCYDHDAVRVKMPDKGSVIEFKNHIKTQWFPIVIYADFESYIKAMDTTAPDPSKSYTLKYQSHEPSGYCFYVKCFDENVYKSMLKQYTGEKSSEKFVEAIENVTKEFYNLPAKEMIFTREDEDSFNKAKVCHICKEWFEEPKEEEDEDEEDENVNTKKKKYKGEKVRDHCHFTGKYRGTAHRTCNLKFRKPNFIPVFFHNLSGYDSHLFIKNLGVSEGEINVIPNNEEKYISFTKKSVVGQYYDKKTKSYKNKTVDIRFLDSFKFMAASLDSLVKNLSDDQLVNFSKFFQGEEFNLLRRKGVYPYEYVSSIEKLKETRLPPKKKFNSKLTGEKISNNDYLHALKVWKTFGMKTMEEYHDLYIKTDVLFLADIFENFRKVCFENYCLDPVWYYTAPGLAWDAALKITGVKLDLLTDKDMFLMIERGIRGGIAMISKRYTRANNKYMGKKYDPNFPRRYIKYLDANNLYGSATRMKLPTGNFSWMSEKQMIDWKKYPCILEVDLEVPKELHDYFNYYPLAPENIVVNKVGKLIPNLGDKKKYVIHYKNLMQYLSLGLKLNKIHSGIKFTGS